ncbi:MAG TPA: DUF2239 family protein [Steroidobacteraceae bacterium]|jgi:hypothetical protein|nr:DUF2239 family protein [Steroidobacteraceae bacterium]
MSEAAVHTYTAFAAAKSLGSGTLPVIALAVKRALAAGRSGPVLIFDDLTGRSIDVDTRGSDAEVLARLARPRGRPKLGVVPREVTLLPRHWQWLAAQPGGASVALRKLVEAARRDRSGQDERRQMQERAFHFMAAMAGDLPGFEAAIRALYAPDAARFAELIAPWPADVRDHASRLAGNVTSLSRRASS